MNMSFFRSLIVMLFTCMICACRSTDNTSPVRERITELEQSIDEPSSPEALLQHYKELLSMISPLDSAYDLTLWKKAQLETNMGLFERAIESYSKLHLTGSSLAIKRKALFMGAFVADEKLNNDRRAEKMYLQYLTEYPSGEHSQDIKTLIQLLGTSNEEALKMLKKQASERNTVEH